MNDVLPAPVTPSTAIKMGSCVILVILWFNDCIEVEVAQKKRMKVRLRTKMNVRSGLMQHDMRTILINRLV